jgi:hypothetical protein
MQLAADPFARLEIGAIVEAFHQAAGVFRYRRIPFGTAPDPSNGWQAFYSTKTCTNSIQSLRVEICE